MAEEREYKETRIHIAEWPDLERKMGIIARMTSDPPPLYTENQLQSEQKASAR
ncbi:MAG: hypothetical protein ACFFCP_16235 [Promethearchaeota archaeon]